mmetsp:Transcript_16432/g.27098  ORF Transcript_16432/g.27098 Transcript_16432/m.27098 type:complete len:356 (+) Transcript_16432:61-1128(+)
MLLSLLEYGRHLPVLHMVLLWLRPISWIRLRWTRRAFRDALTDAQLQELASGLKVPLEGLFQVVEAALGFGYNSARSPEESGAAGADDSIRESAGEQEEEEEEEEVAAQERGQSRATESFACEAAFLALLRGCPVDEAQPMTGVTALMRAAEEGQLRLCSLLLSQKADADCATVGGATALSFALDGTCMHCVHLRRSRCTHIRPRPAIAKSLLHHTRIGLPEAFGMAVRMALQDLEYLPVVTAFVEEQRVSINAELFGPDSRRGTALSVALERRICPVEAPIMYRPRVVAKLLELRADPTSQRSYSAWWGGPAATDIVAFAAANRCDAETLQLLTRTTAASAAADIGSQGDHPLA